MQSTTPHLRNESYPTLQSWNRAYQHRRVLVFYTRFQSEELELARSSEYLERPGSRKQDQSNSRGLFARECVPESNPMHDWRWSHCNVLVQARREVDRRAWAGMARQHRFHPRWCVLPSIRTDESPHQIVAHEDIHVRAIQLRISAMRILVQLSKAGWFQRRQDQEWKEVSDLNTDDVVQLT